MAAINCQFDGCARKCDWSLQSISTENNFGLFIKRCLNYIIACDQSSDDTTFERHAYRTFWMKVRYYFFYLIFFIVPTMFHFQIFCFVSFCLNRCWLFNGFILHTRATINTSISCVILFHSSSVHHFDVMLMTKNAFISFILFGPFSRYSICLIFIDLIVHCFNSIRNKKSNENKQKMYDNRSADESNVCDDWWRRLRRLDLNSEKIQFYLNYDYIHIFFMCHSTSPYLLILCTFLLLSFATLLSLCVQSFFFSYSL